VFEVDVDAQKNLIRVTYGQAVDSEQARIAAERFEQLLPQLKPGFRLLTNMTALDSMDPGCLPHIRRVMDMCNKQGIDRVVRVIPDPRKDIGLNILSLFHYSRRVRIVTVATIDEAVRALEG
jgi:hypothetical protein